MLNIISAIISFDLGLILKIIFANSYWFFAFILFFYYRFENRKMIEFIFSFALIFGMFFVFDLLKINFIGKTFPFETIGVIATALPIFLQKTRFEKSSGKIVLSLIVFLSIFFSWF